MVIDSDLGGSTNFNKIRASHSVASLAAAAASMHLVLHTSLT